MIYVITKCAECPFLAYINEKPTCNITIPRHRLIPAEDQRPDWCRVRKEQIIVRDFK